MAADPAAHPPGQARPAAQDLLRAHGIEKRFGRTHALAGADLDVRAGEIHALLGANGAGKSTLSRVISGHVRRDRGSMTLRGTPLDLDNARAAIASGIAMVMQETSLAPDLSVLENIFLPELGMPGRLRRRVMRERAAAILESLGQGAALPLDQEVRLLSAAQRQLVEIAKALALDPALIIFDEPTASLSPGEVERLFTAMTRLRDAGHGLVFVSHRLEEVFAISDRVSVMREGRTIAASIATAQLTQRELIALMVGQNVHSNLAPRPAATARKNAVLTLDHLHALPAVRDVSLTLHRGEILGLAGLVGAGRSETLETIFGLRPRAGGSMLLEGVAFAPRRPADAIRAGFGLVPEDRRVQSIVPDFSVRENLLLAHLSAHRGFFLDYRRRAAQVTAQLARLGLPSDRMLNGSLLEFSGGMQQKILIARWLLLAPKVLLLDEPTKGVDIGTRTTIYEMLREVAAQGTALLVVSSDFQELLELCDEVVVISDGSTIARMPSAMLDEAKLTLLAAPRSSTETVTALLHALAEQTGGLAFWALLDEERLFCLRAVAVGASSDAGFTAGATPRFEETQIATALRAREAGFVAEPDGARSTLLVPMQGHRGHDLGWIGLTLPGTATPDARALTARIRAHFLAGASDDRPVVHA